MLQVYLLLINNIDENKSNNIGLVLDLFLKLRLPICLVRVGNIDHYVMTVPHSNYL